MSAAELILASSSPRRRDVLAQLGLAFDVRPAPEGIESRWDGTRPPEAFARETAAAKAGAVAADRPDAVVIGADTIVVLAGEVLEKPVDAADARRMLGRMAGRDHLVHTGLAVVGPDGRAAGVETTTVTFRPLSDDEIARYVESGEPLDKAGGYGIQGLGAALVKRVQGCYFNVTGFPVTRFLDLLDEAGLRYDFPGHLGPR